MTQAPPNGKYRVAYEPNADGNPFARAHTANRIPIVDGMRVFTNNLDRGTIDLSDAEWEWNGSEGKYHLWFHVNVDINYSGEACHTRYLQSDDRVVTRFEGKVA